jgi:copper chaperone CopZ
MLMVAKIPLARIARRMTMSTTEYQVTGMTCGHCEMSVREEVEQITGVEDIQVSAATGRLIVTSNGVDDGQVLAAVEEAGYQSVRA